MSNWRDALDQRLGGENARPRAAAEAPREVDAELEIAALPDPEEYKPWIIQRSRTRPAMFIDLRRYDPKSRTLLGSQLSYPHLIAFDYIGDRMVSLDFGSRQCVIEGKGLSNLVPWLQQGLILVIQEYSKAVWAKEPASEIVSKIVIIDQNQERAGY